MNEKNNQSVILTEKAEPKIFNTINAADLMEQEFEPLQFSIDKILPHGLFIFGGNGKIGKSWLALDMCTAVSSGGKLWDFNAEQGDALYLALEDTYRRLHGRLKKIEAEGTDVKRLHLTTAAFGINSGLIEQVHNFLAAYPDTKMIIVDTLERIRDTDQDKSIYSCDYRDMTTLREITNKHNLTLLLIHHTRKMHDPDPLNTLSGSTGLVGSVDGVFVLEKDKRTSNKAKLTISNRDTEGFCFRVELEPENCKWIFMGNDGDAQIETEPAEEKNDILCLVVEEFLKEEWSGTATELSNALNEIDDTTGVTPLNVRKRLEANATLLKDEFNIILESDRNGSKRSIFLRRQTD